MGMKRQFLSQLIDALFILLFMYAAMSKLIDYERFRIQLGESPMLTAFARPLAWIVPAVEIVIAILLAIPKLRLSGLYASFTLMVMFSVYIIVLTGYTEYVPCSCGGVLQDMTWNQHLIFNIVFVILGAIGIMIYKDPIIIQEFKPAPTL